MVSGDFFSVLHMLDLCQSRCKKYEIVPLSIIHNQLPRGQQQ
jgi:hypothetical protein